MDRHYHNPVKFVYRSRRYGESVTVPAGMESDGASGPATDIWSQSWWVHDRLCTTGTWDSGRKATNWQASTVLYDILMEERRWVRAPLWRLATFLFGCERCRRNGMLWLKPDPTGHKTGEVDCGCDH